MPNFAYHKYAEMLGLKGIFVDNPDRVGPLNGHFQFVRLTTADFLND